MRYHANVKKRWCNGICQVVTGVKRKQKGSGYCAKRDQMTKTP
ncbi:hypothetical protein PDIG_79100 [Penicillium digitatum PHI26]|uniref:Uncharacterized protein n=2 Tax=Penicillium digitatum TaxID=36651 RepID=K9FD83_PEND2|nr:hypothetical protein PDIP_27510 [Penicillium digitatum Pd1]EKV06132.1 hypothetical protein PDIG_79100 [Penicillium digitatum PHI26]EKV18374.1 hypothetical protein PDIP_27510 [Penicillium digitatum Pd1]